MCRRLLAVALLTGFTPIRAADYTLGAPLGAENPQAGALLGYAVAAAADGDVPWVVVGALGQHATVFRADRADGPLLLRQTLLNDLGADNYAIALAASASAAGWIAIGANADDATLFNAGRVDVWGPDGQGLHVRVARLLPPMPAATGNFGSAVAFAGQLLAVGEPKALRVSDGVEVGAVHLYQPVAGQWQRLHTLEGGEAGARFGQSVALSSGGTLVVGAPLADAPGAVDAGAVAFFIDDGSGGWISQGRVVAADALANDRLGTSVSIHGDVVASGAANDDKQIGADAGSVYLFARSAGLWTEQTKLRSTQPQVQERFGQAVSLRQDELLVGAYCVTASGCNGPGAVYVYTGAGALWSLRQRLAPGNGEPQSFGHALAHAGWRGAVVGAFTADGGGPADRGLLYPLEPPPDALLADGFEVLPAAPAGRGPATIPAGAAGRSPN